MSFLRPAPRKGRQFLNPIPTQVGGLKVMLKVLPEFLRPAKDRSPRTTPGPFRTDPVLYATPSATGLRVTWFGHSSLLIELDGVHILVDPVWDERASPSRLFGPKRFFPPTIPLDQLPPLDAVLISHDHYDHLGAITVRTLAALNPQLRWITSLGVGPILQGLGVPFANVTELDWTQSATLSGRDGASCQVTSIPSRHFSGRSISNRFETLWASFVLRSSRHTLYYGADSGHWPGYPEIGRTYGPFDLTLLEVGAFNELWADIHLGPAGATRVFQELNAGGLLMPIHWGLFDLALHPWREPIEQTEALAARLNIPLWSPAPGHPSDVHPGTPLLSPWWRPIP